MTLTEPTPTLPEESDLTPTPPERIPHPKRLSHEAAQRLHETGELPDSQRLSDASPHDPEVHANTEEFNKTKAERFAIEAVLIAQMVDKSVNGEGKEARFVSTVPEGSHTSYDDLEFLKIDIWNDRVGGFAQAAQEVFALPGNARAIARLKEVIRDIYESRSPSVPYFREDIVREVVDRIRTEIADRTLNLIHLALREIRDNNLQLSAEQVRQLMLNNIDLLETIAASNIVRSSRYLRTEKDIPYIGIRESTESFSEVDSYIYVNSELIPDGDTYKIKITNVAPRPKTGLYGATVGCPAGFTFDEGDSAIRKLVTAIVNEAYDRGFFEPEHLHDEMGRLRSRHPWKRGSSDAPHVM